MKTTLIFSDSDQKRKVTLRHPKDIRIFRGVRDDHLEWRDREGNVIKSRSFIVIQVPWKMRIDLTSFRLSWHERTTLGYRLDERGDFMEVLFYDRITFTWHMYSLEEYGLFKASQRIIPDFKRHGELFSCYINPRGF
ncbi:hypothetical protein NDS46_31735 (plasmid) [Paenibacillus thiaminolyticus]|uniref:hypothetical protein n=1 Tax=Paenibacillus thiaminolyticus TaxID=49283 RepID=UPI00232ADC16|nr:hypothetical protein [Paenibacillus thiaminolyticus]WCF11531.1 hypothetical protein NDS46_31735 [Paenibacillus thiaminolyticus]